MKNNSNIEVKLPKSLSTKTSYRDNQSKLRPNKNKPCTKLIINKAITGICKLHLD